MEAIASLQDESGQCWRHDPADPKAVGGLVLLCRVVLMRLRSLDVVLYMQHRHPVTNLGLQTDRDIADAMAFLRSVSLPQLQANQPRLQQTLAGALRNKLSRQLTEEVARARLEVESLISEISEREWAAGWHLEAEHRVWAMLLPDYAGEFTGLTGLEPDEASALRSACTPDGSIVVVGYYDGQLLAHDALSGQADECLSVCVEPGPPPQAARLGREQARADGAGWMGGLFVTGMLALSFRFPCQPA